MEHLLRRDDVRLLTLTGPGGTGKTRLGLQVAAQLSDHFADGVFFVNLAAIREPALVLPTIALTLGVIESASRSMVDVLRAFLQEKHILLVLDNFEQVVDASVHVAELLAVCQLLKVIVTSRAALHVRGEQEFVVPPLAVPDSKHLPDLVTLSQYEAVALFIQRAQSVKPDFQMAKENAPVIVAICDRLDGLPLAIELAAVRIKLLPPQALHARLSQLLQVLTSGARDVPERQRTLRNTIAWSYKLLNAEEQRLFRRLSAFVGGCTLEAIEAVCAALDTDATSGQVLDRVASLIDKSLLQQTEQEMKEPRLMMLETIREYGLEILAEDDETEITREAHAAYFLQLTERAARQLVGPQQAEWLDRLEREHDNLRAALRYLLEQGHDKHHVEMALRLSAALRRFWVMRSHMREGLTFMESLLAKSDGVDASVRAKVLFAVGELAGVQGELGQAEVLGR